jgi:tRNA(Ile)-lysidine synthase
MALLHLLLRLAPLNHWTIHVAHFNHRLRGGDSVADAALVRAFARRHKLPCHLGEGDVQRHSRELKVSLEMAGRELRHRFLAETAQAQGIAHIALAHQATDQVELFFLRLLRGSGAEGLAGMQWKSPSPADPKIQLIRPLLGIARADLEHFVKQERISFREDMSNRNLVFERNRIRAELLPRLRRICRSDLEAALGRVTELIRAENEFVQQAAKEWLKHPEHESFSNLHLAVQREVIRQQLWALQLQADFGLVERLRTDPDRPMEVRPALSVLRKPAGKLELIAHRPKEFQSALCHADLIGRGGQVEFGEVTVRWSKTANGGSPRPRRTSGLEQFDADRVGTRVVLRHWQPGDRFQPMGFERPVKLQDLFVNAKIPVDRRRRLVLAATEAGEIFWVEGLRIGERFKLDKLTMTRLKWRWQRSR